jgi:hypothetical protein
MNTPDNLHYAETVWAANQTLWATATLIAILVAGLLTGFSHTENAIAFFAQAGGIGFVSVSLLLLFSKKTSVRIKNMLQYNGRQEPTLIVRGGSRSEKSYVPLSQIDDVQIVEFAGPVWQTTVVGMPAAPTSDAPPPTFKQSFFAIRHEGDEIPVADKSVLGYRGEGLVVTYHARTLSSRGDTHQWRILFPTKRAAELKTLLASHLAH